MLRDIRILIVPFLLEDFKRPRPELEEEREEAFGAARATTTCVYEDERCLWADPASVPKATLFEDLL